MVNTVLELARQAKGGGVIVSLNHTSSHSQILHVTDCPPGTRAWAASYKSYGKIKICN